MSRILQGCSSFQRCRRSFARLVGRSGVGVREEGYGLGDACVLGSEGFEKISPILDEQERLEVVKELGMSGRARFLSTALFGEGGLGFWRRRVLSRRSFARAGGGVEVNEEGPDFSGEIDWGEEEMNGGENSSGGAVCQVGFGADVTGFEDRVVLIQ